MQQLDGTLNLYWPGCYTTQVFAQLKYVLHITGSALDWPLKLRKGPVRTRVSSQISQHAVHAGKVLGYQQGRVARLS